jgi:hypothetical protein
MSSSLSAKTKKSNFTLNSNNKLKSLLKDENLNDDDLLSNENDSLHNVLSVSSDANDLYEQIDPFIDLPERFANLAFEGKKSCILTNIYSTCVTKAISHLELIQNAIDNW